MIKSKKLSQFKEINHAFFNKIGGKSKANYFSLNCGIGSFDNKKNIKSNLKIACKKIHCPSKNLVLLNQVHSSNFFVIKKNYNFKIKFKGDALITNLKRIPIGVLTADCVPILIYDKDKKIISAIHAGWRGAYKGIVEKVVRFLISNGSNPANLIVTIGPSINQKNYEVKTDFKKKFIKKDKMNRIFFKTIKEKTYFSLNKYIYYILKN